ncbi:unnamed protein product [Pleuronectes platessa]|uniref:Uncharacterized protein n=1 Tax=Pleuronectes platessa TaxID=8262 RepID=A0A9N7YJP2_PLEPL|nr:unnamed protein product [Pleuronectes platessa]
MLEAQRRLQARVLSPSESFQALMTRIAHRSRGSAPRPAHSLRDTRPELLHVKELVTDSPAAQWKQGSVCGTGRSSSGGTSRRRRGRRAVGGDWVRRSAAATLDACRALLADHLSYGDRWGNPPAGA